MCGVVRRPSAVASDEPPRVRGAAASQQLPRSAGPSWGLSAMLLLAVPARRAARGAGVVRTVVRARCVGGRKKKAGSWGPRARRCTTRRCTSRLPHAARPLPACAAQACVLACALAKTHRAASSARASPSDRASTPLCGNHGGLSGCLSTRLNCVLCVCGSRERGRGRSCVAGSRGQSLLCSLALKENATRALRQGIVATK